MGRLSLKNAAEHCAKEFTVKYADEAGSEEKIWVRTRTQAETEAAFDATADERIAIKEKYRKGSPFHKLLVADFEYYTIEELAAQVAQSETRDFARKAQVTVPQLMPLDVSKYSSKAALSKAEESYEERQKERDVLIEAEVKRLLDIRISELMASPREALIDMIVRFQVQMAIGAESNWLLETYAIFDCIRDGEDHLKRYFDAIEEIPEEPSIRSMLLDCMNEVDAISPLEIKN